jgi:ABC-type transport system involved in multi-copper enzyme maturation permease subunit
MSKINFKRIQVIFKRDFNEYISWKSYKILLLIFIILTAVMVVVTNLLLPDNPFIKAEQSGMIYRTVVSNIVFLLGLIPSIISIPLFTSGTFTREKANGTIRSLLATQLRPAEIWLGKSFAVFLPSLIIAILSPLVVTLVVSKLVIFSAPLLVTIFLITPLLFLGLAIFTVQLSMIHSSEMSIAPSYLVALTLLLGVPIGSITAYLDITTWNFTFIYLLVTIFIWTLTGVFSFLLTKERIILSK